MQRCSMTKEVYMEPEQVTKPKKKRIWLRILIGIIIFLIAYLGISVCIVDYIYKDLCFQEHFDYESIADPEEYDLNITECDVITTDGLSIHLYEVHHDSPQGVVIMLTGITGPSVTHFYGEAQLVAKTGFASVLVDARGHGQSDGNKITFAIDDVKDVDATVNYIKSQEQYQDLPIIVMGLSMGGATAVNAGSLNENIDGIIALSPYSSWTDVCIETATDSGFPRWTCELLRPGIMLHGFLTFGVDYFRIAPSETIKQLGDKPILIMRSTRDAIVSINNHDRLLKYYDGKNLVEFIRDGDEHHVVKNDQIAYPFDDVEYCTAILNFLEQFKLIKES